MKSDSYDKDTRWHSSLPSPVGHETVEKIVGRPLLSGFNGCDQVILVMFDSKNNLMCDLLIQVKFFDTYLVSLNVPIPVEQPLLSGFNDGDQVIWVMSDSKNNLMCERLIQVKFFDTILYLSTCLFQ
ncbi:hypothetical protein CEXT_429091 [Caerostris extrusa]|uniref:Uncharacterized protein n=1 Tax=Caerostris extrusa TaxID=172846 RepID=A0AAV4U1M7_CAEEX|nr:hypothetical protein CEXT_429091 [Caerostris extrusa]